MASILVEKSQVDALACNLAVLIAGLLLFDPLRIRVGGEGASFNPSNNVAAVAAGKAPLTSNVLRVVRSPPSTLPDMTHHARDERLMIIHQVVVETKRMML